MLLGCNTLRPWDASRWCPSIGGEVTGTGDFCPMRDSSMIDLGIEVPGGQAKTFSSLRCCLRLFLMNPPSSFLSFCKCQSCILVWKLSLPTLAPYPPPPPTNKSLAFEFFLDIRFLEVPNLQTSLWWFKSNNRTIVQNRGQSTFCKGSNYKYFRVSGLHIASATQFFAFSYNL